MINFFLSVELNFSRFRQILKTYFKFLLFLNSKYTYIKVQLYNRAYVYKSMLFNNSSFFQFLYLSNSKIARYNVTKT